MEEDGVAMDVGFVDAIPGDIFRGVAIDLGELSRPYCR